MNKKDKEFLKEASKAFGDLLERQIAAIKSISPKTRDHTFVANSSEIRPEKPFPSSAKCEFKEPPFSRGTFSSNPSTGIYVLTCLDCGSKVTTERQITKCPYCAEKPGKKWTDQDMISLSNFTRYEAAKTAPYILEISASGLFDLWKKEKDRISTL